MALDSGILPEGRDVVGLMTKAEPPFELSKVVLQESITGVEANRHAGSG
jgi:hypothetical protein